MAPRVFPLLACVALTSCATSTRDRAWLSRELQQRAGAATRGTSKEALPAGVKVDDGLNEAEVISIALWRNPALRAELTRIDAAFATLDEARRPANPQASIMGNIGPVTAIATLLLPLESLWQMPARTTAAAREADVAGESTLMRALDLVREARLLHVELGLAADRALVREELAKTANEVARIASVRAGVGDISAMDERVLAADAQTSADASDSARTEVAMASTRLGTTLALDDHAPLRAEFTNETPALPELGALVSIARLNRPDARAADFAITATASRAGWERSRIFNLSLSSDVQWNQAAGPGMRLGGRADLPIFNQNQGGIGRADADAERALAQHEVVVRNVVMEVEIAHARFTQATRSRQRFETEVLPALDAALAMARHGFETGDQSYLVVLDVLRRNGEARLRRAELIAEQRRALCELERAIGARLQTAADVATRLEKETP